MEDYKFYINGQLNIKDYPFDSLEETYVDVKNHPSYEVSNFGNVRNKLTGRILKPQISNSGYKRVVLYDKRQSKGFPVSIHRIEAMSFYNIDNSDSLQVNHIDGNKLNNFLPNLEWCTASENMKHAYENGLEKRSEYQTEMLRLACNKRHPPVKCIETGEIFTDYVKAANKLNVHKSSIWHVINGDQKTTGGLHFESVVSK